MKSIVFLSFLITFNICVANQFNLINKCSYTIWPAILGKSIPDGGGFKLNPGQTHSVKVIEKWSGRLWGRTNCDEKGHCETGDCGNKIQCNGAGGAPPVTLAEFTLGTGGSLDFYDVSLVDGFNVPMSIYPVAGTFVEKMADHYYCHSAVCKNDINAICPPEIQVKSKINGKVIQCLNQCARYFNDPKYCCPTPEICKSGNWNRTLDLMFKKECPDAYSFSYDDAASTFTCVGKPLTNYDIVFCG